MQAHAPVYDGEFQPPPKQYRPKPNQQNTVYQLNKQPIKQSQAQPQQQFQPQQQPQPQLTQQHRTKLPQQYQQPMPYEMKQLSESQPSYSPSSSKFFRMLQTITDTLPDGAGMGHKVTFSLLDVPYL